MTDATVNLIIRANARELARAMQQGKSEVRGFAGEATTQGRRAEQGLRQAGAGANYVETQVRAATAALVTFFSVQAAARGVTDLARRADAYANIAAKIRLATDSDQEYAAAEEELFAISQRTSTQLESTTQLYARANAALKEQGATQREILGLTETINQAFAVSGATAAEQAGAVVQLSQALGAGALRGEEFNSVNEAAPRLMKAIAQELGVTRGELRGLAEDGKITSEVLRRAFGGENAEAIAAEFAELPLTIERSFTQLDNAFTRYIGQADQVTGTSNAIALAIQALGSNLDTVAGIAGVAATILGTRLVVALVQATTAKVEAAIVSGRLAQAEALEAAAARAQALAQQEKLRAFAVANAAVIASVTANSSLAVAEGRATSVTNAARAAAAAKAIAVRALTGALSLMGGPLGIVIAGIALLATNMARASAEARGLKKDVEAALQASAAARGEEGLRRIREEAQTLRERRRELQEDVARRRSNLDALRGNPLASDAVSGVRSRRAYELSLQETELARVTAELGRNEAAQREVAAAQESGSRTTRQVAKDSAEFSRELAKQTETARLNTIELQQGVRARLIAEAITADGVKSEQDLSAARIQQIDALAKQKAAEEAAKQATRDTARADREAESAAKRRAAEIRKLTEAQREYREETERMQAASRGELFAADVELEQGVAAARREGAAAGLSESEVAARVAAMTQAASRAVQDTIDAGRAQLLRATGDVVGAATIEAQGKYQELIDYFTEEGNAAGAQVFQRLFDVDVATAQLDRIRQVYDATMGDLQRSIQQVQAEQQAGLISEWDAQQRIVELYREKSQVVGELLPQMEALAAAIGDPAAIENVRRIRAEYEQMQTQVSALQAGIGNTFVGAASDALESLATRTASLGEAVRGFLGSMAAGLARLSSQALAEAAWSRLISMFNKGQNADVGSGAQKLQTAAMAATAAGGVITLGANQLSNASKELAGAAAALMVANSIGAAGGFSGGGYTGDGGRFQVAGYVHRGEGVLNQDEIRALGGPGGFYALRHAIAAGAVPRLAGAPAVMRSVAPQYSFASGGFASGQLPAPQVGVDIYHLFDYDQLAQKLATRDPMRKMIVDVAVEEGSSIQAAWGAER